MPFMYSFYLKLTDKGKEVFFTVFNESKWTMQTLDTIKHRSIVRMHCIIHFLLHCSIVARKCLDGSTANRCPECWLWAGGYWCLVKRSSNRVAILGWKKHTFHFTLVEWLEVAASWHHSGCFQLLVECFQLQMDLSIPYAVVSLYLPFPDTPFTWINLQPQPSA